MRVIKLTRNDPECWSIMPQVLERLAKFCTELDTETEPWEPVELVRTWFAMGEPKLALWVVVDKEGVLHGHLWATPEPLGVDKVKYVLIRQASIDKHVNIRDTSKEVFDSLKEWSRSIDVHRIVMLTHRKWTLMQRRWGFIPRKVLMDLHFD